MTTDFDARRRLYAEAVEEQLKADIGEERGLYAVLVEAMRYAALGGGKRLRAMLCLEFCRTACGDWRRALPFASAVEMIHAYSLIHDDLPCMDDDDLRRGKPSCHIRFGEANALLAGDALLTRAFEAPLAGCDFTVVGYENTVRALAVLAKCAGADGMVGGQVIDLLYESAGPADEAVLRELHTLKTGALIRASCAMGALAGGMQGERLALCESYAAALGLAFQIVDDILDETSTPEALGKSIGKDRASGKATYVTLYGVARAGEMARACVISAKQSLDALRVEDRFLYDVADWVAGRDR